MDQEQWFALELRNPVRVLGMKASQRVRLFIPEEFSMSTVAPSKKSAARNAPRKTTTKPETDVPPKRPDAIKLLKADHREVEEEPGLI